MKVGKMKEKRTYYYCIGGERKNEMNLDPIVNVRYILIYISLQNFNI